MRTCALHEPEWKNTHRLPKKMRSRAQVRTDSSLYGPLRASGWVSQSPPSLLFPLQGEVRVRASSSFAHRLPPPLHCLSSFSISSSQDAKICATESLGAPSRSLISLRTSSAM